MNLSKSDAEFINKELGHEYISRMDVNSVLAKIDELITFKGFDSNYALNPFGREAQRVYDSILSLN